MTLLDERTADIVARPAADLLSALRQQGLLPDPGPVSDWDRSLTVVPPKTRPIAHQDPRRPHVDGLAGARRHLTQRADHLVQPTGVDHLGRVSDSSLVHQYEGLGASQSYTAYLDLKIFLPAATSVDIQATGNPATITVTNQATGNLRVTIPITLTANSAGQATVLLQPGARDQGFVWYATDLHKV